MPASPSACQLAYPKANNLTVRLSASFGGSDPNRQANAALHRVVVVRMRTHQPTVDYARRRAAEGKSKREIIRCLRICTRNNLAD